MKTTSFSSEENQGSSLLFHLISTLMLFFKITMSLLSCLVLRTNTRSEYRRKTTFAELVLDVLGQGTLRVGKKQLFDALQRCRVNERHGCGLT